MKNSPNLVKYSRVFLVSSGLVLVSFAANADNGNLNLSDPNAMVCEALAKVGIGCGATQITPYISHTSNSTSSTGSGQATSSPTSDSNTSNNSSLTATIYNSGNKNNKRGDVILVRVVGQTETYEIIGGKKHFIPTKDIFYSYGFTDNMIQLITQQQLDKYPRVKLIQIEGNKKKTYYLTEGFMVRLIPNKKVSESYGDRDEDIIVINKKEFNYYPSDQFIFLERPLTRDVFQVVNGKKRYLTPMAVKRMKIRPDDVAPVNETELAYYKTGAPIVF